MSQVKAVPDKFNLADNPPPAVNGYCRSYVATATNAASFGPGSYCNIVFDTSTPGAFLDPDQSRIEGDITFINTNPYIDYLNFGPSGLCSIIQELRCFNQGCPMEEFLNYNVMVETFMRLGNHNQTEFRMFLENSYRPPVYPGEPHANFVKPPMVDLDGLVMHALPINVFGDSNPNTYNSTCAGVYKSFGSTDKGTLVYLPHKDLGVNRQLGVNSNTNGTTNGGGRGTTDASSSKLLSRRPDKYQAPVQNSAQSYDASLMLYDVDRLLKMGETSDTASQNNASNYVHNVDPFDCLPHHSMAEGNINCQTWSNDIDNCYITWPSTHRPEPLILNYARQQMLQNFQRARPQDVMNYLANVKQFPIGIAPGKSFIAKDPEFFCHPQSSTSNAIKTADYPSVMNTDAFFATYLGEIATGQNAASWNWAAVAEFNGTQRETTTMHFSLPIFSGIIGVWATKMFPTLLISPGAFHLQLKFATPSVAFRASMDPCRRVMGTYRDYVPNCGLESYYATEYMGQNIGPSKFQLTAGCLQDGKANFETPLNTWMRLTNAGARGGDFAWSGIMPLPPGNDIMGNTTSSFIPFGYNGYRINLFQFTGSTHNMNEHGVNNAPATQYVILSNTMGFGEGFTTGNAKPQYVLREQPWLTGGNGFSLTNNTNAGNIVDDTNACYGTYNAFSTPQSRRITGRTNVVLNQRNLTNQGGNTIPTYVLNNVCYTGYQYILDDAVTMSIVKLASTGTISVESQSCKCYDNTCTNSSTQNIIIPAKLTEAKMIIGLIQNQTVFSDSDGIYYNSMTGQNPFTAYEHYQDTMFVGSRCPPKYKSAGTGKDAFVWYYSIGNEKLPYNPVTSMVEHITQAERAMHGSSNPDCRLPFWSGFRTARYDTNTNIQFNTVSEYSIFLPNSMTCPFVPIQGLDDQTIVQNPAMIDYLGKNADYNNYDKFNKRGPYVWPAFEPPECSFLFALDLELFQAQGAKSKSGKYLGTSPVVLYMNKAVLFETPSLGTCVVTPGTTNSQPYTVQPIEGTLDSYICRVFIPHWYCLNYMAGGQILAIY